MMFINSINPIKEQQMHKISEYSESLKNESNKEKYNLELVKLNPSCEICYHILVNLSENCIEAAKKLENGGNRQEELSIGREANAQIQNISNQMNKFNRTVGLTSKYNGWYIFGKFLKFTGMFLIAPALLLFGVFTDPYKESFCSNHFQHRPIKEERTRRFIIYGIAFVVGLVLILVIFVKI